MEVKTKNLRLRPLTEAEMESLVAAQTDEHLRAAYGEMLEKMRRDPEHALFITVWQAQKKDGEAVGTFAFMGAPNEDGAVELGYGVEQAYRGNGYATEMVRGMASWAFSRQGVKLLYAEAEAENAASRKVLKKCGFVPDGDGVEGLRFVLGKKPKEKENYMTLGMCIGMCLGVMYGVATDQLAIGISMGMCLGLAVGSGIEKKEKAD